MREIIVTLYMMYWHYYSLMMSFDYHELVQNVLDDMVETIPEWFSSKTLYIDYEDPPEGDIIFLINCWMNDIFGIEKDTTGLVERFNGDSEKFIDYLCSSVEESQENIKRGWEELHQWLRERGRGGPRRVARNRFEN